jgi:hypothetical protein
VSEDTLVPEVTTDGVEGTTTQSGTASPCRTVPVLSKATLTVKMIKRQMYGRANFDLLRLRVLLS